jgi:predicted nucleic acid-binding protein
MTRYLLDTNILIYYFNAEMDAKTKNIVSKIMRESFQLSVISKMEFLGFPFNEQEKFNAERFLSNAQIKPLNDEIVSRVIVMRQNHRIKLPDAIIAATALHYNACLVTRNAKDFEKLSNISVLNPFE